MATLNAKELNNKICSMRSEIRKSIVHHAHKVTANIKRLRAKKGTEEQKLKNSKKADSLVNEIRIIRKLKLDDISILALSNTEEDLQQLMAKVIVPPETKAMAKIGSRVIVQNIVKEFRSKYPNFYEEITKLLEARYDNRKKKKKEKMKGKKLKSNKMAKDERFKSLSKNKVAHSDDERESDDDSVPDLVPISSSGLNNSNSEETDEETSEYDESRDTFLNLSKHETSDLGESDSDNEIQVENNSIASKRSKMISDVKQRKTEGDSISKVEENKKISKNEKTLNTELNESSEDEAEPETESESNSASSEDESNDKRSNKERKRDSLKNEKNRVEQPTETNVDPFFMTADNKEYCTLLKVEKPNNPKDEKESGGQNRPGRKYEEKINSGENFGERKSYKDNFDSTRSFGDNRKRFTNDLSRPAKRPNRNFGEKFRYFDKVKSNYYKFQNNDRRKTGGKNTNNYFKSESPINNFNRKSDSKKDISENVKLHPSWEAKKKLSTQSVQFQGKKITFGDD